MNVKSIFPFSKAIGRWIVIEWICSPTEPASQSGETPLRQKSKAKIEHLTRDTLNHVTHRTVGSLTCWLSPQLGKRKMLSTLSDRHFLDVLNTLTTTGSRCESHLAMAIESLHWMQLLIYFLISGVTGSSKPLATVRDHSKYAASPAPSRNFDTQEKKKKTQRPVRWY